MKTTNEINRRFELLFEQITHDQQNDIVIFLNHLQSNYDEYIAIKRLQKETVMNNENIRMSVSFSISSENIINQISKIIFKESYSRLPNIERRNVIEAYYDNNQSFVLNRNFEDYEEDQIEKGESNYSNVVKNYIKKAFVVLESAVMNNCIGITTPYILNYDEVFESWNLLHNIKTFKKISDVEFILAKSSTSKRVTPKRYENEEDDTGYTPYNFSFQDVCLLIDDKRIFNLAKPKPTYYEFQSKIDATTFVTKIEMVRKRFAIQYQNEIEEFEKRGMIL